MSEVDDDKWEITRITPEVQIDLGGELVEATYRNTAIYKFCGQWAMFEHVFVAKEGNFGAYIFNEPDLQEQLAEMRYPIIIQPYPSDSDMLAYRNWQRLKLEQELEDL